MLSRHGKPEQVIMVRISLCFFVGPDTMTNDDIIGLAIIGL